MKEEENLYSALATISSAVWEWRHLTWTLGTEDGSCEVRHRTCRNISSTQRCATTRPKLSLSSPRSRVTAVSTLGRSAVDRQIEIDKSTTWSSCLAAAAAAARWGSGWWGRCWCSRPAARWCWPSPPRSSSPGHTRVLATLGTGDTGVLATLGYWQHWGTGNTGVLATLGHYGDTRHTVLGYWGTGNTGVLGTLGTLCWGLPPGWHCRWWGRGRWGQPAGPRHQLSWSGVFAEHCIMLYLQLILLFSDDDSRR